MNNYLPLGTIVVLKNGTKKLIITGRYQVLEGTDGVWDYSAFLYPEGNLDPNSSFVFNKEDIKQVIFNGYSDEEDVAFQLKIPSKRHLGVTYEV